MPDTPSITIIKSFTYRGLAEEFSNTYHFSGTTPVDYAAWKALADAIITAERPTVESNVTFVQAYGYAAGTNHSVAQIDYRVAPNTVLAGTLTSDGMQMMPGDVAATVRWQTPDYTEYGKRIYLRKYFHGVKALNTTQIDKLNLNQSTALATFAAKLIDGTLPGSFKYCGPQGAVASNPAVNQWLTTRTLKRRGKRPPTATP